MRVLVTEDEIGGSKEAIASLESAGHDIVRCQPHDGTVRPCVGLGGGECPLSEPVDVAVAVHSEASGGELVARGFGIVCAGRAGVPLVSINSSMANPLPGYPTTLGASVVEAVARVAARETRPSVNELAEVARQALAATEDALTDDQIVEVTYVEGPASYDVLVELPVTVSPQGRGLVEAGLRAAIRFDGDRHPIPLRDISAQARA